MPHSLPRDEQCKSAKVPMLCLSPKLVGTQHIYHLHIAKMAGRSIMEGGPHLFKLPSCQWQPTDFFVSNKASAADQSGEALAQLARKHANKSRPCFLSQEFSWNPIVPAYPSPPIVMTMLRSPLDWVMSAAAHWQRNDSLCSLSSITGTCHRNNGLDDLVDSGCFWRPGTFNLKNQGPCRRNTSVGIIEMGWWPYSACNHKCLSNYFFPLFPLSRLTGMYDIGTREKCEDTIRVANKHLDTMLVGLSDEYVASLCLWRFQLGLTLRLEPCRSLCAPQHSRVDTRLSRSAYIREGSDQSLQRLKSIPTTVSQKSLKTIEASMMPYARVYSRAETIFYERIAVAEEATGVKLLCRKQ